MRHEPDAPQGPVRYTISFPEAHLHYAQVDLAVPGNGRTETCLGLPVWVPGSYMVREFAKQVDRVTAADGAGRPIPVHKVSKNHWVVRNGGEPFGVRYRVYACRQTVRESWVDLDRATINPPNLLLYVNGMEQRPVELEIATRPEWGRVDVPLDPLPGRGHRYSAADYEALADAVIQCGNHAAVEFEVEGIRHVVTAVGAGNWDLPRIARDCEKIVRVCLAMFGRLPYPDYRFMLEGVNLKGSGGLEHKRCALMTMPARGFAKEEDYRKRLTLIAHEYFHVWNVKKIHPVGLSPFNWDEETYTDLLWVAEGFTQYYESILMYRAGLIDETAYLKTIATKISDFMKVPGRRVQSVAESSYDTWIKYYRPDENSTNTHISYYLKGALVGLLLDLAIREKSGGKASLDDLMRRLDAASDQEGYAGYTFATVKELAEELSGANLTAFFKRYVFGTDEIDFGKALARAGLKLTRVDVDNPQPWLGTTTVLEPNGNQPVVEKVLSIGPAAGVGLSLGDVILALDGSRVTEATIKERLLDYKVGDRVKLTLFRNDLLREVEITLERRPSYDCRVERGGRTGAKLLAAFLAREPARAGSKAVKVREAVKVR